MWGVAAKMQQAPASFDSVVSEVRSAELSEDTVSRNHRLDSVVVQAHRAGVNTPVTFSEVSGYPIDIVAIHIP